jgi:Skp family chaperone for outer membrane proteins
MSEPTRGLRLIVLAALLLGIVAALGAGAAPDNSGGGLKVATLDTTRVLSEYKGTVASNNQLRKMADDYQLTFQTWKQNPLLSEADQKRMSDLVLKGANATEAEKAELKKLQDQSSALYSEFVNLQTKGGAALTEADKARITALTKLAGDTDSRIQFRSKEADDQFRKIQGDNLNRILKEVRDGVAKVAKKGGYNLVLSNEMAWYAENDITEDVLKELNK